MSDKDFRNEVLNLMTENANVHFREDVCDLLSAVLGK